MYYKKIFRKISEALQLCSIPAFEFYKTIPSKILILADQALSFELSEILAKSFQRDHKFFNFSLQEICFGRGIQCAENVTISKKECVIPCEGLYADVIRYDADEIDIKHYDAAILEKYYKYKRFFNQTLRGNITNIQSYRLGHPQRLYIRMCRLFI